jgi:hypothetical protein
MFCQFLHNCFPRQVRLYCEWCWRQIFVNVKFTLTLRELFFVSQHWMTFRTVSAALSVHQPSSHISWFIMCYLRDNHFSVIIKLEPCMPQKNLLYSVIRIRSYLVQVLEELLTLGHHILWPCEIHWRLHVHCCYLPWHEDGI